MFEPRPKKSDGVEVIGWSEYGSLLKPTLQMQAEYARGLARYVATRQRRRRYPSPASALPSPPDSRWVDAARDVASRALVDIRWMRHSERTWLFANALAEHDGQQLDDKVLYVACLLHDVGLFQEDRTRCFAVESALIAGVTSTGCAQDDPSPQIVANAIKSHISVAPDNNVGKYLRAGSLLDVTGMRVWDLDDSYVHSVCERWSRSGFDRDLRHRWRDECQRFRHGRASYARCPGALCAASYLAPLVLPSAG
jgi:hypothetical protein